MTFCCRTRALVAAPIRGYCHADLSYDPAHPLAVTMVLFTPNWRVEWTFARDLLYQAMFCQPAGEADVQLTLLGKRLEMALSSDDGWSLLYLTTEDVRRFLAKTYRLVPAGSEFVDVDRMLADLLGPCPTPGGDDINHFLPNPDEE